MLLRSLKRRLRHLIGKVPLGDIKQSWNSNPNQKSQKPTHLTAHSKWVDSPEKHRKMINYQSQNPSKNFIMVDRGIDDDLSPDAYFLLIKLMKLAPKADNSNASLKKKTGFGKRKFDQAKKELVDKGYLDTKQLYDNRYAYYIGKESVKDYKKRFKKSDNRFEKNEIQIIKQEKSDGIKM